MMGCNLKLVPLLVVLAIQCYYTSSQDVIGCGGFVKSEVEINFSVIEIKLYTKQGTLKYQTDCAPNNGYYMIPLYDKGAYVLKVEPPPGWTFEPEQVELLVDGTTDMCSRGEDINFQFTGFGVVGKVISKGQKEGPQGVTVALKKPDSKDSLKETVTEKGGKYVFENVLPGDYIVSASHPVWKFEKASTKVAVDKETGNAGSAITVQGYDVKGHVVSEGDPIKDVNFILYSDTVSGKDLSTVCDQKEIKNLPKHKGKSPVCNAVSQGNGDFTFPCLQYGSYTLVPFYQGKNIKFDVVPGELSFTVEHESQTLSETFEVAGFSVSGKVLNVAGGIGVGDALIVLNGKDQVRTKSDGTYHLDSMKAGHYSIEVRSKEMYFDPTPLKITPNTPILQDIVAARFDLCGKVVIDKIPEGLQRVSRERQVVIKGRKADSEPISLTTDREGSFCAPVKPGTYSVKVILTETEQKAGLKLAPIEKEVTVKDKPVGGIVFSQFRATVTGVITCLEKCGQLQVSLNPIGRGEEGKFTQATELKKGATFGFTEVMPGKYRVSILKDEWCWKEKTLDIDVLDRDLTNLEFLQSGYILSCSLSHDITLNFALEKNPGNVGSFDLTKGVNKFCLAEPGIYKLVPSSCHQFEQDTYRYDTASPSVLTLAAIRHKVQGSVTTKDKWTDISVTVKSSLEGQQPTVLGPLKNEKDKNKEGMNVYSFVYWAKSGEKLQITASAKELLFYPESMEVTVQGDTCVGEVSTLEGRPGVFIAGSIVPALGGVNIVITADNDPKNKVEISTNEKGAFKVGPLHGDTEYGVQASKEGYVLTAVEGKLGHFKAFKLGEVAVKVTDEKGEALQGVLLSLSGGAQYRSNNLTHPNGTINFIGLSPGQYFLRPMMKEFKFEPNSQMIDVLEGSTKVVNIKGKRVSYSCYGQVTSLNGEAEPGVFVEAIGQGNDCQQYQEESKTEQDGSFRIRGLQPNCDYHIQLKLGDANNHIERAAPVLKQVKVSKEDIVGVNIIAFRRMNQLDLSGNVITKEEYLTNLKILLFKESNFDSPIHSVSLGATTFFHLPSLTMDGQNYFVRLDSTLSKASYEFASQEISFNANSSYQHFTFHFDPKPKTVDQDLNQSSVMVLPMTLLLIYVIYHHQKILPIFQNFLSNVQTRVNKSAAAANVKHQESSNIADISAELLLDSQPSKKKNKPRKV